MPIDHFSTYEEYPVDPLAETQPGTGLDQLSNYQAIPIRREKPPRPITRKNKHFTCVGVLFIPLFLMALLLAYFFIPMRTNLVILGIDDRNPGDALGRSDTIIASTFVPAKMYVGMLSIPRDLWVEIPGQGENRINTAHFFAEAENPGSGPEAVKQAIRHNFGIDVNYYARFRFDNFVKVVDILGGVEIDLPEAMSGFPAGKHILGSEDALAFVRDRQGSDDFFRMARAQIFLRATIRTILRPENLLRMPNILGTLLETIDSDIPVYHWPRLGFILLISGIDQIDSRAIDRTMVTPFTTTGGAQVLGPNWNVINPVVEEIFGR